MQATLSRRLPAALVALALFAESTGASDLSLMLNPGLRTALTPPRAAALPAGGARFPGKSSRPAPDRFPTAEPEAAPEAPPAQAPEPSVDRMLVLKPKGYVGVAPAPDPDLPLSELLAQLRPRASGARPVFCERFEQPWVQGRGIRARVVYLRPVGVTWGDEAGYHGQVGAGTLVHVPGPVPAAYRRSFPLYLGGDRVDYEVEVENTSALPLSGLTLYARQERFDPGGGAGRRLGPPRPPEALAALPLGGKTVSRGAFILSGGGRALLNFEQTHLTVVESGARRDDVLLDAPQAGIADPPR